MKNCNDDLERKYLELIEIKNIELIMDRYESEK